MSDKNEQVNEDYDTITIDDLSIDTRMTEFKHQARLDIETYKQRKAHNVTFCTYCRKRDLCGNGVFSKVAKNNVSDRTEAPVWFCCECCSSMYKHETGIIPMPDDQFKDMLKRCYPAMHAKRYSV
jgi:hypothetical protein